MKNKEKIDYTIYFIKKIVELISENYYYDFPYESIYDAIIESIVQLMDTYSIYIPTSKQPKIKPEKNDIVQDFFLPTQNIAIFKLNEITENTVENLRELIKKYQSEKTNRIILDLRNSPGGFVSCAVEICNLFLSERALFKSFNQKGQYHTYYSHLQEQPFQKMAILVNENTKSASEAIALAFQDAGYILIGNTTYGKGIAQNIYDIFGHGILKISSFEVFGIDGYKINKHGIKPNIETSKTTTDIIEIAIDILSNE